MNSATFYPFPVKGLKKYLIISKYIIVYTHTLLSVTCDRKNIQKIASIRSGKTSKKRLLSLLAIHFYPISTLYCGKFRVVVPVKSFQLLYCLSLLSTKMLYNMYIYNRRGKCLFYQEWYRPHNTFHDDPLEERKLV